MNLPQTDNQPSGPLAGIHVIDFSSFIAGPFAAMLLGDLGATIVKVEPPPSGDLARAWAPFMAGESRFFQAWNRNKRSLAIDLTKPEAREAVYELVRRSDVVVENFRRGVTEKLHIDYQTLSALNPRLIYASTTAFGSRGPDRDRPGYDPVLQSLSGAARANQRFNGGTVAIGSIASADYQASMLLAGGVLAALYHRERTGVGQMVETSLLQGVLSAQSHFFVRALEREEEGGLGIYPYRFFQTKDDLIFIAAGTDKFWRLLCSALNASELGADPAYATNPQRVIAAAALTARLQPYFREKTSAEWHALLVANGVPCAPAQTYDEFFDDPQVSAMDMNPVIEHSTIGSMRVPGIPIHLEKTPGAIQLPAPTLGQHTAEILRELDYSDEQIEQWKNLQLVRVGPTK